MTSLAEVYITLIGFDSVFIQVTGKGRTDSNVLGLQLLAAWGKILIQGSVIGEKLDSVLGLSSPLSCVQK